MRSSKFRKGLLFVSVFFLLLVMSAFSASALEYRNDIKLKVGLEFGPTSPAVTEFTSPEGFRVVDFNEETYELTPLFETAQTEITIRNVGGIGAIYQKNGTEIYRSTTQAMYITGIGGTIDYNGKTYCEVIKLFFKDGLMRVINIVSFETYLKGVLPREVYPSWPDEALKAAAVAARTYALYSLGGKHNKYGVDICTTTCCQVYGGNGKNEFASTNAAVENTKNTVLAYDGKLAMTVYTATAGDHTESSAGAWGGDQSLHPYLCGVPTPFETVDEYANGSWSNTYTVSDILAYINSKSAYAGKIKDGITSIIAEYAENGYARKLTVTDIYGNSVSAKNSGNVRGLVSKFAKSAKFTVTPNYDTSSSSVSVLTADGIVKSSDVPFGRTILRADGSTETLTPAGNPVSYTFTGTGWGHGVGMSQNGAMTLAKQGLTYEEILYLYYPGTYLTTLSALAGIEETEDVNGEAPTESVPEEENTQVTEGTAESTTPESVPETVPEASPTEQPTENTDDSATNQEIGTEVTEDTAIQ